MNNLPDQQAPSEPHQKPLHILRQALIAVSVSVTFGLLMWVVFDYTDSFELMSNVFLFWLPFAIGAVSLYAYSWKSFLLTISLPLLSITLLFLLIWSFGLDGSLCIVILTLPFLVFSIVGGIFISIVKFATGKDQISVVVVAVFPLIAGPIENQFNGSYQVNEVVSTVVVNAEKEHVWNEIIRIADIREEELPWTFTHAIGIPKPVGSTLSYEGVGGVRSIQWKNGIQFQEHITEWEENEYFSYLIEVDSTNLSLRALDKHVHIGGQYFDVLDGCYTLQELPGNRTQINLHCRYRLTTRFNWYAQLWGDFLIDDFQQAILAVVKGRVEAISY